MSKFKVGDIVVGNDASDDKYACTNKKNKFVGKVVRVGCDGCFDAEILENKRISEIGAYMKNLKPVYFKLKEREKKIMNTKEAVNYLFDNPTKKLIIVKDAQGQDMRGRGLLSAVNNELLWEDKQRFALFIENDLREYEVFEDRKLKRMSWGEAYYTFINDSHTTTTDLISCISSLDYDRPNSKISREEYLSEWTIEGIYED